MMFSRVLMAAVCGLYFVRIINHPLSSFRKEDDLEESISDERTAAIVKRDKVLGGGVMYIAINIRKVDFRYTTVAKC